MIDDLIRGMNGLTKLLQDSRAALREPAVNQIAMPFASEFFDPTSFPPELSSGAELVMCPKISIVDDAPTVRQAEQLQVGVKYGAWQPSISVIESPKVATPQLGMP